MKFLNNLRNKMYANMYNSMCDVTLNKRFLAYIIDWFVGYLFIFFIPIIGYSMLTGSTNTVEATLFLNYPGNYGLIYCIVALIMGMIYYVVIPWKVWRGQTLGKRAFGFKIVQKDGSDVTLWSLVKRQLLGVILIEGYLFALYTVYQQLLYLVYGYNFTTVLSWLWIILSTLSCILLVFVGNGRMIHDYVGNTNVIMDPNRKLNDRKDERI